MTKANEIAVEAWKTFCARMSALGERILEDDFPTSEFDRAEGVRHLATQLAGWLAWEAGFSEPHFPMFMRHNDQVMRWGGPNTDQTSIRVSVTEGARYRIHGNMRSCEDFILSVKDGDMHEGKYRILAETTASDLGIGPGDDFSIEVGGEPRDSMWMALPEGSTYLNVRQYYFGWQIAEPALMVIERLDTAGQPAPTLTTERMCEILDNAATRIESSVIYWNDYMRNSLAEVGANQIAVPRQVAGGADNIFYCDGFFDLDDEQVLLIDCDAPENGYWDWQLYNMAWFETLDHSCRMSSLNHHQIHVDDDGKFRLAISRHDPGIANWLDPAEHRNGMIIFRCIKSTSWRPSPTATLITRDEITQHVPANTRWVTADERREQICARQAHIATRFRV
jgi:hypothetical protein